MTKSKGLCEARTIWLKVALLSPLLLGSLVKGQGYGATDDDAEVFNGNQFPSGQQANSLPQYDSQYNSGSGLVSGGGSGGGRPKPQGQSSPNLWWQGQNAFQRPPGHPGVQQLAPNKNAGGQQPQQQPQQPSSYPGQTGSYNPQGSGSGGWQQPTNSQYQNAPQQQFNNPTPNPRPQQPRPQQFKPSGGGQQPQYNNPAPQNQNQAGNGWNPPSISSFPSQPQQYQPQGQGFGSPPEDNPPCDLINKADCHNRRNFNNAPQIPPQNYQPPPIDPQPYPEDDSYNQAQPQQPDIPQPNLSYRPPSPQPQQPQQQPSSQQTSSPYQQQPQQTYNPNQNNYLPNNNNPYNSPDPADSPQPNEPYPQPSPIQPDPQPHLPPSQPRPNTFNPAPANPPPSFQPQPQRPPTQPQPQPQRPSTNPEPRPQQYQPPQKPRPRPVPQQQSQAPEEAPVPYPGCPAAMLCVQDEYCNKIGLIEEQPIQLSAAERLHRVALMQCSEPMTGIVGVCCRDPNYVDPWPDMNGNGMPKKDGQHHAHHPDKSQKQPQAQGQKSPYFAPQQPPQGNHLAAGGGAPSNPYSDIKKIKPTLHDESGRGRSKNAFSSSSASLPPSESKQTLQVLEPCLRDELCISMSQCHSLNPEFMEKTGLNPKSKLHHISSYNQSEPIKIKRCKYERSGIQYLCCKKPEKTFTTSFTTSTTSKPIISYRPFSPFFSSPKPTPPHFAIGTTSAAQHSSLITGVGLRFHSGLHSDRQRELNNKKSNPYKENEQPILLVTSPITAATTTSTRPLLLPTSLSLSPSTKSLKTETTTPTPFKLSQSNRIISHSPTSTSTLPFSASISTKLLITTRPVLLQSSIFTATTSSTATPTNSDKGKDLSSTETMSTIPSTSTQPPTTTEGPVDINKIPVNVPLALNLKDDPPIGFIFKGDDLFIPELEVPSQNFLVPVNDFEERILPTDPPPEEQPLTEEGGTGFSSEATTIYSILDENDDKNDTTIFHGENK